MENRKPQRSTENGGIGQSGYAAGRHHPDPALAKQIDVKNPRHAEHKPEENDVADELGTDDRWTGRSKRADTVPEDES